MTTTTLAGHHPNDLPIWGRLSLIRQGIPFHQVTGWDRGNERRICAYLDTYGYVYLYKR